MDAVQNDCVFFQIEYMVGYVAFVLAKLNDSRTNPRLFGVIWSSE
jgi:hypothetical protein